MDPYIGASVNISSFHKQQATCNICHMNFNVVREKAREFNAKKDFLIAEEARRRYLTQCVPLHQATLKGDWGTARGLIELYPALVRERITAGAETALHIATAVKHTMFVQELVNLMSSEDLEIQNGNENTALCFAATAGIVRVAELMVQKNERLPMIRGRKRMLPLYMAALLGHADMVGYLYGVTNFHEMTPEDRIGLLIVCITTGLYGMSLSYIH